MVEPGWYDDPDGGGGRRWWDGVRWSEHTIPPPPGAIPPPPGAILPPPGAIPPPPGAVLPPPPPGAPGVTARQPAAEEAVPGPAPVAPMVARPPSHARSGARRRVPRVGLLSLLGVVLLVAVGGVVIALMGGEDEPGVDLISSGEQREYVVDEDGQWELVIEVPEGLLVIDVRGEGGFDPVAALTDDSGREIDRNADRSMEQLEQYGGGAFDSLIERQVPAGTYRVVITGFAGQGGAGQVSFPVVGG